MTLRLLKSHQAKMAHHAAVQKKRVRVPFSRWQYETVHAFLNHLRDNGSVELELGAPIKVEVDWSHQNDEKAPHIFFQGKHAHKTVLIKDVLEAAMTPQEKNDVD